MEAVNLPKNIELEQNILGSILIDKNVLPFIMSSLKEEVFYDLKHQRIFKTINDMYNKNIAIDLTTVAQMMSNEQSLTEVGGAYYLSKLTDSIVRTNHLNTHIAMAVELYKKRQTYLLLKSVEHEFLDIDNESLDLISSLNSKLLGLQEFGNIDEKSIEQIVLSVIEKRDMVQNGEILGYKTGFSELDSVISGWCKPDLVVIAARPGCGKCLGYGTKIIMFDGSIKEVEKLKVGDCLMGVDSKPRKVLSLARGEENMYWVRQKNGFDYRVNESHILSLKRSRNGITVSNGDVLNIPLKEYIPKGLKFKSNYKGYKTGFELNEHKRFNNLDPYILGLWLGDGSSAGPGLSAIEKEVVETFCSYATSLNLGVRVEKKNKGSVSYFLNRGTNKTNLFLDELHRYNLIKNKHIPNDFLYNSKKYRLELLAGLLDTDGYLNKEGSCYEITQKNHLLANQIVYLARTLGFRANPRKIVAKSQNGTKSEVIRTTISGGVHVIPCKIKRKIAKPAKPNKNHLCTGIKVEFDKFDNYFGFTLDKDGLFLLEDTTVTHNTSFMLSSAHHLAIEQGIATAIFSLEMSSEQLVERLESITAQVPLKRLRINNMNDYEKKVLLKADNKILQAPLYIDDSGGLNIQQLRAKATIMKQKYGIKVIFIDYMQLMSGVGKANQNREQEISTISRGLKSLAKELEIPIIALSQLSRRVEERADKIPLLSDLRESGAIEQDSDIVLMLMRPEYYEMTEPVEIRGKEYSPQGLLICKVEKNRHGVCVSIPLRFIGETVTIQNHTI